MFKIIAILMLLEFSFGLNSKKFCKNEIKSCSSQRNTNVKSRCRPAIECAGKYGYTCYESLCATEKQHCDEFKKMFSLMATLHMKSIETVTKSFAACNHSTYALKKADICLSEQNCFLSQNSLFRINVTVVRPIQCACSDKHRFQCGSDYCAVSSEACDAFYYGKRQPAANFKSSSCHNTKNITRKDTQYLGYLRF